MSFAKVRWVCEHDHSLHCPVQGCPVQFGCARKRGWPEEELPPEFRKVVPLENLVSRRGTEAVLKPLPDATAYMPRIVPAVRPTK